MTSEVNVSGGIFIGKTEGRSSRIEYTVVRVYSVSELQAIVNRLIESG